MVKRLPTVIIGDKIYFIDYRLRELRNVKDPSDKKPISYLIFLEDME